MNTGKRQHLQDIYSSDQTAKDDYTPQVSSEIMEERKREMRRHQITSFAMGATILVLAISLVYVVVREYMDILSQSNAPDPITQEYIPRYTLAAEAQWVLDFDRNYGAPEEWDGEGNPPFNSAWLKKAAFNIILAEQAVEVGEYGEATEYYEDVLQIVPDIEGVRVPMGMAYFKLEKFDRAIELLKDAPDADLTHDVLNNLGAACIEAKTYEEAEDYLKRSLKKKPAYAEAFKNMAVLYKKQDRQKEATAAYENYLDQRPSDIDVRYDFALYLTKIGNWELAGEQLRILTQEVTDVANLYIVQARVETKLGNFEAATEASRRAMHLTDPNQALLWMNDTEFDKLREQEDFQALVKALEERRAK